MGCLLSVSAVIAVIRSLTCGVQVSRNPPDGRPEGRRRARGGRSRTVRDMRRRADGKPDPDPDSAADAASAAPALREAATSSEGSGGREAQL